MKAFRIKGCIATGLLLMACAVGVQVRAGVLVENATLLTMAEGGEAPYTGYLLSGDDGLIEAVGPGAYPDDVPDGVERVDAGGKLVMPGFVSGHNHLWQSAFRGIALDSVLYPWLEALHRTYGDYLGEGDFYWFTLHGALDQLSHGITTTYNHSQRLGASEAHYLESLDAEMDAGQHFIFAYNNDVGLPADEMTERFDAFMDKAQSAMNEPGSPMLAASINAVGNFRGGGALAREMALAEQYGITAQLHYLEQYSRREKDRAKWSSLMEAGAVAPNTSFAHFIHTTDDILADTVDKGAGMVWNPLSNGRLASGLADIPRYLEMGIPVGMGVDGAASADIADPFQNMRMGMYALRMQHKEAGVMMPMDVLRLHTLATAQMLGVADRVGSLEKGKRADFLIIDPAVPLTGPIFDVASHLVAAVDADNIESIYVAGDKRVEEGEVLGHDMRDIQARVVGRVNRIRRAAGDDIDGQP